MKVLILIISCFGSVAFADDFKTLAGKEYKDATVSRVEPDGIVLTSKAGISKVYFIELPKEVQERFGYAPQKAADYSAQQNAGLEQVRKQQEEALRRDGKRRKRQINIAQNKQVGRMTFARSKPGMMSFRDKKTTCSSELAKRSNRDLRTGAAKTIKRCVTARIGKHRSCHCSRAT